VDGNDVEAVYETASAAAKRARQGGGPTLIEAKTYRLQGHMYGDSEMYRTKEEVANWRKQDPILRLKKKLLEQELATEDSLAEMEERVIALLKQAEQSARLSCEPDKEQILLDVF